MRSGRKNRARGDAEPMEEQPCGGSELRTVRDLENEGAQEVQREIRWGRAEREGGGRTLRGIRDNFALAGSSSWENRAERATERERERAHAGVSGLRGGVYCAP